MADLFTIQITTYIQLALDFMCTMCTMCRQATRDSSFQVSIPP